METTTTSATDTPPLTSPSADPTVHEDLHSLQKARSSIDSLSSLLPSHLPHSLSSSNNPAFTLLHDHHSASQISSMLRRAESGAGDDDLFRWLYDTFQSNDPNLQLVVLRFVPLVTGLYLSRIARRKTLAGFEAVLLALYGSETASRAGQAVTVSIPDMSHSSIYHESKTSPQNNSTELNMAIISPSLELHSTVKATRRAKIVGVALELYFSKISQMPVGSKLEFCEFCEVWAGQDGDMFKEGTEQAITISEVPLEDPKPKATKQEPTQTETEHEATKQEPPQTSETQHETTKQGPTETETFPREGRTPLPWELLGPVLRILGHCLMGLNYKDNALQEAAYKACRSLHARAMHDVSPRALLATESLLRLGKIAMVGNGDDYVDPTEPPTQTVIAL